MAENAPKGYWIARVDVSNTEAYGQYRALNAIAFQKYGGRFIVRGPAGKVARGTARAHNVVIEFRDYETALACYESPEYQAAKVYLDQVGEVDLVIVAGFTG
ncbi:MAG: hypothetical protein FD175_595 [Beijerinckiaceae bacterium]|nr:MAG: hypothetical protein FD175_595 [Beijerinckiaceae bacterium]